MHFQIFAPLGHAASNQATLSEANQIDLLASKVWVVVHPMADLLNLMVKRVK